MTRDPVSPRYVDVFELARTHGALHGQLPIDAMLRLASSLGSREGSLSYELQGDVDDHRRPAARLHFGGTVQLVCDRCGGTVPFRLDGDLRYYFVRTEAELDRIPVDDSPDEPLLGSARFDVHALIEDEAILALPISLRHAACRPAAEAGQTAAEGEPERRHPFAVLAQLKSRRQ
jgi:uncharacterized protein